MNLSLVTATCNQPASIEKQFLDLALQNELPDEILVADADSTDFTRAVIDGWRHAIPVLIHHLWHPDDGFLKTKILNQAVAQTILTTLFPFVPEFVPRKLPYGTPTSFCRGRPITLVTITQASPSSPSPT